LLLLVSLVLLVSPMSLVSPVSLLSNLLASHAFALLIDPSLETVRSAKRQSASLAAATAM
jgi:hypothetical protein